MDAAARDAVGAGLHLSPNRLPLTATTLHFWDDGAAAELAATPGEFLARLPGPLEIFQRGRDRSRYRVVVGMLHGNEPSGLVAIHRWLRAGRTPAVDTSLFVVAVEAARLPPGLAHRMPPGRRDLNRSFAGPFDDVDGALARALHRRIAHRPCEALIDLHNNTGRNPPYGVLTRPSPAHLALVSLFADTTCLLSELKLGTLLEVIADAFPAVTIECGQAHTPAADDVATRGLTRFLDSERLPLASVPESHRFFEQPVRVNLRSGIRLAFAEQPVSEVDLTLRPDIENHNFQRPADGTVVGWLQPGAAWPFRSADAAGRDVSRDCFVLGDDGVLRWRGDLVPIMMTTDARVAFADCLCYLMRQRGLPVAA